jgi:uncharacterized protein with FMN-binding domain
VDRHGWRTYELWYYLHAGAYLVLVLEALAAQTARVDTVSGATVTSDGYRRSPQPALDLARHG